MTRIREVVQLNLSLNPAISPVARRLQEAIISSIASDDLLEGDRLPSTRMIASTYKMSRSAAVEAFETLCGLGILVSAHDSRCQRRT